MSIRSKLTCFAAAAGLALVPAAEAVAQACAGYPAAQGQFSLGGRFAAAAWTVEEQGATLGAEASYNRPGNAAVFAHLNLLSDAVEEGRDPVIGLGAAYQLDRFVPALPAWLDVCPVASVVMHRVDGSTRLSIPLGLGFGTELVLADALALMPYAIPQFQLVQVGFDEITWDHRFGIGFGGLVRIGNTLYAGAEFGRNFVEGASFDVAIRGGVMFPVGGVGQAALR
jgi:hypothetical protein